MSTLPFSAASERNKDPILEQLKRLVPSDSVVLEIGSGWGQHAVFFSHELPGISWQPSEMSEAIPELNLRLEAEASDAIRSPLQLNVLEDSWPERSFDIVYSANTAHIMSWDAVCAMFAGIEVCLKAGGLFCLYGPFNIDGSFTSPGNRSFDQGLRGRNAGMGIRHLEALESLSASHQMKLQEYVSLPANNLLLVFKKHTGAAETT